MTCLSSSEMDSNRLVTPASRRRLSNWSFSAPGSTPEKLPAIQAETLSTWTQNTLIRLEDPAVMSRNPIYKIPLVTAGLARSGHLRCGYHLQIENWIHFSSSPRGSYTDTFCTGLVNKWCEESPTKCWVTSRDYRILGFLGPRIAILNKDDDNDGQPTN